jgi:DNA-binding GntR family transcriptional regulator
MKHSFRVERIAAPLRHSVTDSIRNAIAVGHFLPGERMLERELCEMIGVSRTLVREALRQLESEGLIKLLAHKGPVVVSLTPKQALDIYTVRMELEGLTCELFVRNARAEDLTRLEASFERLKVALPSGDPLTMLEAKNEFYALLVAGAGNEALGDTLRMLNSRVTLLRATSLQASGRALQSISELEKLLVALRNSDAAAARAAAVAHVRAAADVAIREMQASLDVA